MIEYKHDPPRYAQARFGVQTLILRGHGKCMTLCGWENAKISPTHVLHKTLRVYMSKNAPHYCEGAFLVGCEIGEKCYN